MSFPGMDVGPALLSPDGPPLTISVFNFAVSDSNSITFPANIQAGDIIVIANKATSGSPPADKIPSGFTGIVTGTGGNTRHRSSIKLATGEESGSLSLMNGTASNYNVMLVFRASRPVTSFNLVGMTHETTSGNPDPQVITASESNGFATLVVGIYGVQTGTISPRTMTPAKDGEQNNNGTAPSAAQVHLAWKFFQQGDALSDVTIDMDDEGSANFLNGFYLELF